MLKEWNKLPKYMRTKAVRPYYESLRKKKLSLKIKRVFDFMVSLTMLAILLPLGLVLSIMIMLDSKGNVFFCQERITQYGRKFRIIKFRTMIANAEKYGAQITISNDMRVTKIGKVLRKYRLDEIPQLINVLLGDMSFVGPRPEVEKYVKQYTPEMMATLLVPAGITSEASIEYRDEAKLLKTADDVDRVYVQKVLPGKMKYNLKSIRDFSFWGEIRTMFQTVFVVLRKEYE